MGLPADHVIEALTPLRGELIAAATATLRRHARDWTDYVSQIVRRQYRRSA